MKRWIFVFLSLLPSLTLAEVPKNAIQVTIDDGLSQSTVSDLLQDRSGRIWFATGDGISIYDGDDFEYIYRSPKAEEGFQGVYIQSIFEDRNGNIWVGSLGGGIGVFNQDGEYLQGFSAEQGTLEAVDVYGFSQDKNGSIWVASNEGLLQFHKEFESYRLDTVTALSAPNGSKLVRSVLALADGSILAGTASGGLARYEPQSDILTWFTPENSALGSIALHKLFRDQSGKIWIGTEDAGVFAFDPKEETFSQPVILPDSNIPAISEGPDGRLWFGSDANGVFVFDPNNGRLENYRAQEGQTHRISSNSILAVFPDRSGRMWLGTGDGGASSVSLHPDFFETYYPDTLGQKGPPSGVIWAFAEGQNNDVWIGTKHGLSRFFRTEQRFAEIPLGETSPDVRAILRRGSELLIGVRNRGLVLYDTLKGEVQEVKGEDGKNLFDGVYIRLILEDHDKTLWVGTHSGLFHLSADLQIIGKYRADEGAARLPHNRIRGLYQSPSGQLWVGTSGGLSAYHPETNDFTTFAGREFLPSDDVRAIYEHTGSLYVGTESGIAILALSDMTARFVLREHGLPNETIYSLLPDEAGSLWIMTNNGLVQMNLTTETLEVYRARDGLQGAEFNFNAYHRFEDGTIAVGGINGVSFFNPKNLAKNALEPILSFTSDADSITEEQNESVGVEPQSISFTFGVHHYDEPSENRLRWKLEPLDAEWNESVGVKYHLTRENLPAGAYLLRYQAVSPSGVVTTERSQRFTIETAYYLRWYAFLAYAVLSVLMIASIVSLRTTQVRRRNTDLQRIISEKTTALQESNASLQEVARDRAHFYSRTAHEIRTPLSLIRAPIQSLLQGKGLPAQERRMVQIMERASDRLIQITEEMVAVAQDKGGIKTGQAVVDLSAFLYPILELYSESAKAKGVALRQDCEGGKAATFDHRSAETILHNALSNAVKNTPRGGVIEFSCCMTPSTLEFSLKNDGPGFSPEQVECLKHFAQSSDVPPPARGLEIIGASLRSAGGTLEVEPGRSALRMTLPAHTIGTVPSTAPQTVSQVGPRDRILIVEDDLDLREYLSELLSQVANVHTVASLSAAQRAIEREVFHLVLCDVTLPDGSGFDFGKGIKEHVETSHIPLIFLTALSDEASYQSGLDAWADDYLTKPFENAELLAKIRIRLRAVASLREHLQKALTQSKPDAVPSGTDLAPLDERFVGRFQTFLEAQVGNSGVTLEYAAKACAMSKRALQRKLEALYGQSFSSTLTTARMQRAAELLRARQSVTEVASACGYVNLSSFSRQFKDTHGMSPRDFVKKSSL